MLEIKCPYCGKRSQNEFSYGGDASVKRPEENTQSFGIMLQAADNGLKFYEAPQLMKFLKPLK